MSRKLKNVLYEQFARLGKAVSSSGRIELLDLLCQGEKTVEMLSKQSQLEPKNTSAQLKELKAANLITSRKKGKYVYYRIEDESVLTFFVSLRALAEKHFLEVQKVVEDYLADPSDFKPSDRKKLLTQARNGDVVIIDVRPHDEYQSGHLPFARSIPLDELKKKLKTLPKSKKIVAYCRGPYCFLSVEAVEFLRSKGFKATGFKDGVVEWKSAGLPVEKEEREINCHD